MPSWPTISVEISFNSECIPQFLQADAVYSAGWTGTAATWTNVTAYVLAFGYTRGRQRQLGRAEAGSGYLTLDNSDGRFDPENASSPYGSDGAWARPGKHVRIRATWSGVTYDLFRGYIDGWEPRELSRSDSPTTRIRLSDSIAWMSRASDIFNLSAQLTGNAIRTLLADDLTISSTLFNIDDGQLSIAAYGGAITANPWSEIQKIADSEEGTICFVDGAGQITYHDHLRRYGRERSIVLQAVFDNGPGQASGSLPYTSVAYTRDMTEFYTRAEVTRVGGTTQTETLTGYVDRYFERVVSRSTRNATDLSASRVGQRILKKAQTHFEDHGMAQHTSVTIAAGVGNASLWPKALGLTISDQIEVVERLYPSSRTRTIQSFIEGMSVDVDMASLRWDVTYRLSRALSAFHWTIRGKGVAFPSTPTTNDLYYREDLDLLCFYDGTRWLSVNEFEAPFLGALAQPISGSGVDVGYLPTSAYDKWVIGCRLSYYVLTTNNGSNFWTMAVLNSTTGATLGSLSSAAVGAGSWNSGEAGISASVNVPTQLRVTKTGAPGNLYVSGALRYRYIVT